MPHNKHAPTGADFSEQSPVMSPVSRTNKRTTDDDDDAAFVLREVDDFPGAAADGASTTTDDTSPYGGVCDVRVDSTTTKKTKTGPAHDPIATSDSASGALSVVSGGSAKRAPFGFADDDSSLSADGTETEDRPAFSAEEEVKSTGATVGFFEIFRFATCGDRVLMIVGGILAFISGGGIPAYAFVYGRVMSDLISSSDPRDQTAKTALIMVYIGCGMFVAAGGHVLCWTISAAHQTACIRLRFFEACLRQDIGWHDEHSPGELTARMTGDTRVIQNGINDKFSQGIMYLSMGLLGFVFGFVFCWELTLVMLGMVPFLTFFAAVIGNFMSKMAEESRRQFAKAGAIATEVMENVRTVQTFGQEDHEAKRFRDAVLEAQTQGIKKELMANLTAGTIMGLVFVTYMLAFFFASYLVVWGRTSMGDVVSTFMSVLMGSFGLGFVSPSMSSFVEARASAFEVFKAIDRVPPVDIDKAGGEEVTGLHDCIEFDHVKFSYPTRPDMVLFRDLCLTIKKGQKVAFSGASGCGKSSAIGLIQRFYDPIDGAIRVDGRDMRDLDLFQWRSQIGIVSQEPNLFAGTMWENVRVGKPGATDEEVIQACKEANIHDTIMRLPDAYDTEVGAVGSQLSGGQKQRIAIARALVKRPAVLLLDEATSALDRKSEVEVQGALDELMKTGTMTVIIIAHRLATIRDVDCIYYVKFDGVEGSTISETGNFNELMALNGEFAAMAKIQGVVADSGNDKATKKKADKKKPDHLNVILDDEELAKLDAEVPRTERQKIPIEQLAKWEVSQVDVGFCRLLTLNRDKLWALCLAVVGSAILGAARPTVTILMGHVMYALGYYDVDHDEKALRRDTNLYASLFAVFAAANFGGWLLTFLYGYAGEHMTTKIRTMLFRQILRQDMSFFDIPGRDAGTLAGMLSGDCEAVHQLWGPSIGLKVQMVCTVAAGLIVGFIHQWKVAFVALACMPIIAGTMIAENIVMRNFTKDKEGDCDDTIVTEALSNVRTVTSFNMKNDRVAAYRAVVAEDTPRDVKKGIVAGIVFGFTQFVFYAVYALCFWYGGKLISDGEADFKQVVIASTSVLMGAMGAGEAGGFATKMVDAQRGAKRVFSIIDRVPDVDSYVEGDKEIGDGCDIRFQKLQFIYPARPKQVVLASVDLGFHDATANGLMGQTGCGKSTIIQMLARFYDRRSGRISVNNKDLSDIDIVEWRKNISIVLQEPNLFSGTVRENILYARPDATDEEVIEAAKLAHIHHEIIKWPEGYDTEVGYKGRALSGGQKQRVAIARGLLRRPKLLLLDEATSALDNVTEAKVQKGIDKFTAKYGLTSVSIAHRLTTIRNCDQIVLLDAGHIIEQGSHDELMALGGEYRTRWELYNNAT